MPNPFEPEKVVIGKCTPGGCGSTASEIAPNTMKSILQQAISNTQNPWSTGFMTWEWFGERNTNLAFISVIAPLFPTTPTSPTTKAPTPPTNPPTTKTPTAPTEAPPIGVGTGKGCVNNRLCIRAIGVASQWVSTDLPTNTGTGCEVSSCTQIEVRVKNDARWSPGYVDPGNGKCGYNLHVPFTSLDIRITNDKNEVVISTNVIQDNSANQDWNVNSYFASCSGNTPTTKNPTTKTPTTKTPTTKVPTTKSPANTPTTKTPTTKNPTNGGSGNCPSKVEFKGYYPSGWGFAFVQENTFDELETNGCGNNLQCSDVKVNGNSCSVQDTSACSCALSSQMSAGDNMNIQITSGSKTITGVVNVDTIAHNAMWYMPYDFNDCSCGSSPTTKTPTTKNPTTKTPTTKVPTTKNPTTKNPTTKNPTTKTPTTKSPASDPTTKTPTTKTPTTKNPTTKQPTTKNPTTKTPTNANPCEGGSGSSGVSGGVNCNEIKLKLSWGSGQWYISIWNNFDLQLPVPCELSEIYIKRPSVSIWTKCTLSNTAFTCGGVKFVDDGDTPNIDVKLVMNENFPIIKYGVIKGYQANSEWLFGVITPQQCQTSNCANCAQAEIVCLYVYHSYLYCF